MRTKHLTIVLPFLCLLAGCQGKGERVSLPSPVRVKVMAAPSGVSAMEKQYSGTVEEENGTPLSFATAGTVQALHFHVGQQVAKGQLLATLDPTSTQNAYNAARATLEQAQDAYRRMKELHDKGSLPDIKWVEVQSKLEQAVSMEQIASKNLKDCKLYAPYSGVIARKEVETGQNVMPGMPVAQLVTASVLRIKVAVPETEISAIGMGQEAAIRVSALDGSTYKATVVEKGIVANPLSRSYEVKLKVDGSHTELLPGMVADVSIRLAGNGTVRLLPADSLSHLAAAAGFECGYGGSPGVCQPGAAYPAQSASKASAGGLGKGCASDCPGGGCRSGLLLPQMCVSALVGVYRGLLLHWGRGVCPGGQHPQQEGEGAKAGKVRAGIKGAESQPEDI